MRAGQRALDVACGQGNAAIAAARRFAEATGVDYAANLLAQGRERAAAEHLDGDVHRGRRRDSCRFPDGSFDLALSTVGVMFAPDHQRAADELVRVTAAGGKIALASWTPDRHDRRSCSGRWAPGRRRRPACVRRRCGAPRST